MAGTSGVHWDPKGIKEALTAAAVAARLKDTAEAVAAHAGEGWDGHVQGVPGDVEMPVRVDVAETHSFRVDRLKAWVTLAHPSGLAVQAKHGVLTQAASAEGLKVMEWDGSRDLVEYTSKDGNVSTVTRGQALNWGGSFTEL